MLKTWEKLVEKKMKKIRKTNDSFSLKILSRDNPFINPQLSKV